MSSYVVPSLDTDGYVYDLKLKLSKLYNYFLIAEHSQTTLYIDNAVSLNHLLEVYADDMEELRDRVEESLLTYLNKYFGVVELTVGIKEDKVTNKPNINIAIKVTEEDGSVATLSESLDLSKNKFIKYGYVEVKV